VAAAAKEAGAAIDVLNFWQMPEPFVVEEGRQRLAPGYRARLVAPVFSLVGGAVHQDVGLMRHPRPFDFVWPERPELPLIEGAEIIPFSALHAAMAVRTRPYLEIMSAVREAVAGRMFHLESPPTYAEEELPADDPGFYDYFGKDAAFSPAWLRFKLWRVHSAIVAAHCATEGITFVPHPAEAVTEAGFLRAEFHGTPAHANKVYGRLLVAQMRDLARTAGG
jgi:hypothetical protein